VENLEVINPGFWQNKSVFITGHTGFKGSWLSIWLASLGAKVHGYSLASPTDPSLFEVAGVASFISNHTIGDVRDRAALERAIDRARPDIILHLAAQPLVRQAYVDPVFTLETNVIGTMNLLECARVCDGVKAIVNVTTDKCYENKESLRPYRETDELGGFDVYSASKACSELVTGAYRRSFLAESGKYVATARAGNVIGGGDWSVDRLIPDFLRALDVGATLRIRYPDSVRPWQHVLEVLSGYMLVAERLYSDGAAFAGPWNFGPRDSDCKSVGWIVEHLCSICPGATWALDGAPKPHEAHLLTLDASKAHRELGWSSVWDLPEALSKTVLWHKAWREQRDMLQVSLSQIQSFVADGRGAV
jgi:CDP-glucose 4,6-dehydratase